MALSTGALGCGCWSDPLPDSTSRTFAILVPDLTSDLSAAWASGELTAAPAGLQPVELRCADPLGHGVTKPFSGWYLPGPNARPAADLLVKFDSGTAVAHLSCQACMLVATTTHGRHAPSDKVSGEGS